MIDHKDLKEWVKWAKQQPMMADEQPLFIKAIEDAISQAGMASALKTQLNKVTDEKNDALSAASIHADEHRLARDKLADAEGQRDRVLSALADIAAQDCCRANYPDCKACRAIDVIAHRGLGRDLDEALTAKEKQNGPNAQLLSEDKK